MKGIAIYPFTPVPDLKSSSLVCVMTTISAGALSFSVIDRLANGLTSPSVCQVYP
jgi:hypothetical protein